MKLKYVTFNRPVRSVYLDMHLVESYSTEQGQGLTLELVGDYVVAKVPLEKRDNGNEHQAELWYGPSLVMYFQPEVDANPQTAWSGLKGGKK